MAKEVTPEQIAEKLRKPIQAAIQSALETNAASIFADQITALEKQRDSGKLTNTQKAKVMEAIDSLTEAEQAANEPIYLLVAEAIKIAAGPDVPLSVGLPSAGGRGRAKIAGTRMTQRDKERLAVEAMSIISKTKEGLSRAQIATNLQIEPAQAATVLKAMLTDGTIRKEGDKAATRYFPK